VRLTCQGCATTSDDMDNVDEMVARARYKGWRVFKGASAAGTALKAIWCPDCVDKHRPRNPKPPAVMDGQMTIDFEELT
jgi:hypothetical protein